MSFTLNELRSKLPSGVRINFVEHVGVKDGFVTLKTVLTIGKLADDAASSKEYSKYMHGFLMQVDLNRVASHPYFYHIKLFNFILVSKTAETLVCSYEGELPIHIRPIDDNDLANFGIRLPGYLQNTYVTVYLPFWRRSLLFTSRK